MSISKQKSFVYWLNFPEGFGFFQLNSSQNLTWEMERACIPSNLGPPDAIVEQVELCLEGPAIAGRLELRRAATSSGSQWRTTVIRPLLSMIFQDGIWSCRPSVYRVSQTIVGMASITARKKIFSNICGKFYEKLACFTYFLKDFCNFCNIFWDLAEFITTSNTFFDLRDSLTQKAGPPCIPKRRLARIKTHQLYRFIQLSHTFLFYGKG